MRPLDAPVRPNAGTAASLTVGLSIKDIIAPEAGVLRYGVEKCPQMALESGQGLNQCAEGPFSVFGITTVCPQFVDKSFLMLNNAADFGNTVSSRRKRIVGFV
jgi:hypothetical protein